MKENTRQNLFVCSTDRHRHGGHTWAVCDALNPDEQHLETHNIRVYLMALNGPPSFKRRFHIITHLKQGHGAADSKGLAERWHCTTFKRFWSCEFCICCFPTLADRLRHIDKEHFTRHDSIGDWSPTKVICGLLSQPDVNKAWQRLVDSLVSPTQALAGAGRI